MIELERVDFINSDKQKYRNSPNYVRVKNPIDSRGFGIGLTGEIVSIDGDHRIVKYVSPGSHWDKTLVLRLRALPRHTMKCRDISTIKLLIYIAKAEPKSIEFKKLLNDSGVVGSGCTRLLQRKVEKLIRRGYLNSFSSTYQGAYTLTTEGQSYLHEIRNETYDD